MASGMKVQQREAQTFHPLHFINKCLPGIPELYRVGTAQIDEIAVMRQNVFRLITALTAVLAECIN